MIIGYMKILLILVPYKITSSAKSANLLVESCNLSATFFLGKLHG
jgi:hypothetical protein